MVKRTIEDVRDEHIYTQEALDLYGLTGIVKDFEASLNEYLALVKQIGAYNLREIIQRGSFPRELVMDVLPVLFDTVMKIPEADVRSYTLTKGLIEKTWRAAHELKDSYDLAVAVGRKGLWISHIFRLAGWDVSDVLSLRLNDYERLSLPLSVEISNMASKRVLILENDTVTGSTVSSVSEGILQSSPSSVDLFLLFTYLSLPQEVFAEMDRRQLIASSRVIGSRTCTSIGYENGRPIELPPSRWVSFEAPEAAEMNVGKVHGAEDFVVHQNDLNEIGRRLKSGPSVAQMIRQKVRS
ncbi:MAG: hypothetical protein ACP5N9_03580 [Candidatus Bilamarchaeum sp.]